MMAKRMILNLGLAAVLLPRLLCAQQAGKQEERSNDTVAPATISAGQAPAANATLVAATTTQVAPSTTLQAATTIPAATTPTGTTPTAQTTTMAATTSMAEETTTSIAAATTTSAAATTKYISNANVIRILHLSDTHNLHDSIESKFPLPPADILIHTGDFCNFGKDTELTDANKWLGTLASRYKHIIIILGNHDWGCCSWPAGQAAAKPPSFWRSKFSNAHLLWSESVTVMGLKIYGTSWKGDTPLSNQKNLGKIPSGMDILLTHGPAFGILDFCGKGPWGSSEELLNDILVAKPKVHLFGHDHEQRGLWQRKSPGEPYVGGVEYHISRGSSAKAFGTTGPPPAQYAVEVVSNNAMMNQPAYEGWLPQHIAGPARLIVATKSNEEWHFSAEKYDLGPSCGNITNAVNAKCMEKVIWAASGGGKNNANAGTWFGKMLGIAGVSYQDASQEDFQRLYYCHPPGGFACGLPPCTCSTPPCDSC
ncbi:unnamed protein product [Polarella glacialis]|uniref:Calcineurin-like phosphoesterase domain-containing protein n=1 Tax=Polarella glacialis TaxID=89957 RepID=A0A813DTV6_POLGL|nr:unnamed protein product [Polarella glacialis]